MPLLIWVSQNNIFGNDDFHPGRADPGFKLLSSKGLAKISDLYNGKEFLSFEELKSKYFF